jgi:hypothetical protein
LMCSCDRTRIVPSRSVHCTVVFVWCREVRWGVHGTAWDFVPHFGVKVWVFVTYSWGQLMVFLTQYRSNIWGL